jgi:hypothetical protein
MTEKAETLEEALPEVEGQLRRTLRLIDTREPGIAHWWLYFGDSLQNLKKVIDDFMGPPPPDQTSTARQSPSEKAIMWRGSSTDFATDVVEHLTKEKLVALIKALVNKLATYDGE